MQVRIVYLGILKDLAGRAVQQQDVSVGSTVGDLWKHLLSTYPTFARFNGSLAIAVNNEYAAPDVVLSEGDEVALLPPVSGGTDAVPATAPADLLSPHCCITRRRIAAQPVIEAVERPEDGAACIFDGIVRNNTRGRRTLYLDYEAYEQMAIQQMESLAEQALREHKVREVRIIHRLGRLEIGETSILIVVASAHRGPAFEACRWLIDTLKKTVPIWKKEYFEDGAVWADGEEFPPELRVTRD
ncbi:MAG TPA: molybdenum cofactor biosynthesis protein MoaE [Clostridia bacterium]|nr:molybdenum cofactor biosynthesis protein MoaE [Clostridia bacterium]